MRVSHVMRREVVTITADQTLQNAAATMRLFDVGVLSVEEGNKLIGIVTERDIAIRGIADGMGPDAKVRDVMTYEVKCCFEDEDHWPRGREHGGAAGALPASDQPG